ncbi:hypothetical protein [Thetidibacter halocola]|uniref:Uncharacterized protein n=1 Tax=Thetidibacter halocola TaxID=2827239 RepID=A0A8J8B8U7_9RHOB|nr:hypothetical protein [Thetidibacter halocola]MBS0126616.1 hypothetical protein [Thetidibacter halocola]
MPIMSPFAVSAAMMRMQGDLWVRNVRMWQVLCTAGMRQQVALAGMGRISRPAPQPARTGALRSVKRADTARRKPAKSADIEAADPAENPHLPV